LPSAERNLPGNQTNDLEQLYDESDTADDGSFQAAQEYMLIKGTNLS
jgi:hypothetical protein